MGTLLFGVITGPDMRTAEQKFEAAKSEIDGIEMRLDTFQQIDMEAIQAFFVKCRIPVMLTLRRKDQGGSFEGTEKERLDLLEALCTLGPTYVDLEYDVPVELRKKLFEQHPRIGFLSSYHDFVETPEDLEAVYRKVHTPYAHIVKIVTTAQSSIDALEMLHFIQSRSDREKIIGICMGEEGKLTRILAPVVGCFLTYASLGNNSTSWQSLGQLTASELQGTYRFRKLNAQTSIYALIGDPIEKSLGAVVHNAFYEQEGINAVYIKIRIGIEMLPLFFNLIRSLPFRGLSVTMPLKEAVMPFLAQVSIQTRVIGACNTIHIVDQQLLGYNTDGTGALNAIERRGVVYGKHLVFIGAGGAAKALIFEASQRGAFVTVINRTPAKALELASLFGGHGGGWEIFEEVCKKGYDIIINSIPESDLIEDRWILPEKIAMDIVYVPKNTPFLVKASGKKCQIVFGYEMFVGQMIEQLRIWFPNEGIDFDRTQAMVEEIVVRAIS